MKNICLILCFISGFSSIAFSQYKVLPKNGEGRVDRSGNAVFWPNYLFTHPSVFISNGQAEVRPMRKWWRDPVQPVVTSPLPATEQNQTMGFPYPDARATVFFRPSKDFPAQSRSTFISEVNGAMDLLPKAKSSRTEILQAADQCLLTKEILKKLNIPKPPGLEESEDK